MSRPANHQKEKAAMTTKTLFDGRYYTSFRRKQIAHLRPWVPGDDT